MAYYYASGRKIELEDDNDHVAVDRAVAQKAGLASQVAASADASGPGGGVVLAQRSTLSKGTLSTLRKAGALQPVYKRDRAVVVAMPEVRVEFDTPAQRRTILQVLAKIRSPSHEIVTNTDDRIVIRPTSGRGDDALHIANEIYERAHPAAASVRFIQFVPRPMPRK
jgi:hypothetical protein